MELSVNKYLGKMPRDKETLMNVYAFYFENEKETAIETLNINYPVDFVLKKFMAKRLIDLGYSQDQLLNSSNLETLVERHYPIRKLHVIVDRSINRISLTEDNTEDDNEFLISTIRNWIKTVPWFGNDSDGMDELKDSYWPHRSYFAAPLWAFRGIEKFLDLEEVGDYTKMWVIVYDSRDTNIVEEINRQILPEYDGSGGLWELRDYVSEYDVIIDNKAFNAPLILIDKKDSNEFDIEKRIAGLVNVLLHVPNDTILEKLIRDFRYVGYDLQDLFYVFFRDSVSLEDFANRFDKSVSEDKKDAFIKRLSDLGVDLNDKDLMDFAKNLFIFLRAFPASDTNYHYKLFFSVISIKLGFDEPPADPVTKNEGLFNSFFSLIEGPIVIENKVFYLFSSRFCFPKNIFNLFIDNPSLDMHDIYEFNSRNGMLSKYYIVNNYFHEEAYVMEYDSKVVSPFVKKMQELLGERISDNRFNEKLSVKRLSEFPFVFDSLKIAFDREGIEFKDINVIFVNDARSSNVIGGYDSKRMNNTENITLIEGYSAFKLPLIVINIANPNIQRREALSRIVIHEGKHYLDDMRVEQGKEKPEFFDNDYHGETNHDLKMEKYLSSTSEISAFTEEALSILRHYRLEYIYSNWLFLKTNIIHEYFLERKNIKHYELPQDILGKYSKIMENALDLYEKEEFLKSGEKNDEKQAVS